VGVDPSLFEVKKHADRGHRLLFVGRLVAAKGLPILLEAMTQLGGQRCYKSLATWPDRKVSRIWPPITWSSRPESAFSAINRKRRCVNFLSSGRICPQPVSRRVCLSF